MSPVRVNGATKSDHAMSLYKEGKYAEAAQAFESELAENTSRPERRVIYVYLGKSYESAGRIDKAVSSYEKAVDYDRRNWRRHRDLAGLYEQVELYWEAVASYKTALKLNPREPSLYLALGRTWREIGLYSYAIEWLNKAVAAEVTPAETQRQLSLVYEGQGRFDDAAAASAKADDDPKRLVYLAALAGNKSLAEEGIRRLRQKAVSSETIQAYENLVQLTSLPPKEILASKLFKKP